MSADFAEKNPLTILIAEDNLVNQSLAIRTLKKLGYEPRVAMNGVEVLTLLNEQKFDLILMDVQMPEMDGLEATRIIRTTGKHQPTIIAMTANVMAEDIEMCVQAGMDGFVPKPIKLDDMLSVLTKWAKQISSAQGTSSKNSQ